MQSTHLYLAAIGILAAMILIAVLVPGAAIVAGMLGMFAVIFVGFAASMEPGERDGRRDRRERGGSS